MPNFSKNVFDHNLVFHAQNVSSLATQLCNVKHKIFQLGQVSVSKTSSFSLIQNVYHVLLVCAVYYQEDVNSFMAEVPII